MAVIEITADNSIFTINSGSIGFGFNPELQVVVNTALFDTPIAELDTVVYRCNPDVIKWKGVVRVIERDLNSESAILTCYAAESTLEALSWTPTKDAYNKEILCRNKLLNATIADVILNEFTNNSTGPQNWFTSIEVPVSIASLIAGPADTYQVSFLSLIEAITAIHPHVRWLVEYDSSSTGILPVGKLVLVDTKLGRTARVLTIGSGQVAHCKIKEDYSACAAEFNVYGAGDFVEVEEELVPAWDTADEVIPTTIYATAPLLSDYETALAASKQLVTPLQWGYDLTSTPEVYVNLTGAEEKLIAGRDYVLDAVHGVIVWTMLVAYVNPAGTMVTAPTAGYRALAAINPDFYGKTLRVTFSYCGPDCYRLYHVAEPIANLRLRNSLVPDPNNPGQVMPLPVEQSTVIEAFKPLSSYDITDPHFQTLPNYEVAKVWVPDDSTVTWDSRNSEYGSAKGFGLPIGSPEFEEGRECVRFEERQLSSIFLGFTDLDNPPSGYPFWYSWKIKVRYTAWRNLLQTRASAHGVGYVGRFVFSDVRKYTALSGALTAVVSAVVSGGSVTAGVVNHAGAGYTSAPAVTISGDGVGATAHATVDSNGGVASIIIDTPGTGYTSAVISVNDSAGILVDQTSLLSSKADDVLAYYGGAQWTGEAAVTTTMHTTSGPNRKVADMPYAVGDKVTLAGAVDSALAASFIGIINDIQLAQLETGLCQFSIGTRVPQRNPFEPKPPVFVDVAANGTKVLDVSGLQRRSI